LAAADSLARVLDDFAPRRDGFLGVDPAPVDPGLADGESELGVPRIDRRCLDENASHVVFQNCSGDATVCGAGTPAQCHLVKPPWRHLIKWWGGPPGRPATV